ncbi:MAG: EF-hand domain-containing protein [Steroidobacteraceae bacterium]
MNVSSSSSLSLLASNLFNKLDSTQKGYLESSDMQSALSSVSSSSNTSSTDTSNLFAQLDSDSDGQITETEFSDGIQTLVDALQSSLQQSRMQGPQGAGGPPPPPPPEGADEGFTQDELSSMASDTSSTDTKRSELFTKLADNFEAADTDGNGKITRDEAMAYDQSTQSTDASSTVAASTSSTSDTTTNLKMMLQVMQLLQAYGSSNSTTTSSVSVAA